MEHSQIRCRESPLKYCAVLKKPRETGQSLQSRYSTPTLTGEEAVETNIATRRYKTDVRPKSSLGAGVATIGN